MLGFLIEIDELASNIEKKMQTKTKKISNLVIVNNTD